MAETWSDTWMRTESRLVQTIAPPASYVLQLQLPVETTETQALGLLHVTGQGEVELAHVRGFLDALERTYLGITAFQRYLDLLLRLWQVTTRDLTAWAATAAWGEIAYLLVGLYVLVATAREATWGSPPLEPIVVGLVAVVAYAAVGYLAGALVPSLFTAPLVSIALYLIPALTYTLNYGSPVSFLSPWTTLDPGRYSVLRGVWPDRVCRCRSGSVAWQGLRWCSSPSDANEQLWCGRRYS